MTYQPGRCRTAAPIPYCYPGSSVLKNRLGLRDQAELDAFEALITAQRGEEPLPRGGFRLRHYRAIHHHLFQDVFEWAGKCRTVRIAKGGSMFCYPECIEGEMREAVHKSCAPDDFLRNLPAREFARLSADFLAELNAIHPFREGNGRTLAHLSDLARGARRTSAWRWSAWSPVAMLAAMVGEFQRRQGSARRLD